MTWEPIVTASEVTEIVINVGGLPAGFSVVADSRRSDPVRLTYQVGGPYETREVYFTIEQAKAVGAALRDAAGALEAQLRLQEEPKP